MAKRGSVKALSQAHEKAVAALYSGKVSPSSGGAISDQGDVRTDLLLIECKLSGGPGRVCDRHDQIDCDCKRPTLSRQMEKIAVEAYSESRFPRIALRYYDPHSFLANREGWVDLAVSLAKDDAAHMDRTGDRDGD